MIRKILFLILFVAPVHLFAQFTDDFADGDFTTSPVWSGTDTSFIVNTSFQLQLNTTGANTSYLSTPNALASLDNTEWHFFIRENFAGSANNFGRVYLVSNNADVSSPLNGYYLQFGEALSNDAVELFRLTGSTSVSVCRGTAAQIASSFAIGVKVTRDATGLWTLFVDGAGGTNYLLEATGTDLTYTTSAYFGVQCTYTSSNATNFYFDDFFVGPLTVDVTPPTITSASVISSTQLDVKFSEPLEQTTAQTLTNYSVNNGIGTPSVAVRDGSDFSLVHLTFATAFASSVLNTITINNVKDYSNNTIAANSTTTFTYFLTSSATFKDVLINEILADITPQIGLPSAEYSEIYNRSSTAFDLTGWTFTDGTSTATFPTKVLTPGSYLIICSTTNAPLFTSFGDVLGLPSFPSLNDGGDHLQLFNDSAVLIDDVSYDPSWYQDAVKDDGGWSLELINPNAGLGCTDASNWIASNDVAGGTPGTINSVYSAAVDTTHPVIISAQAVDSVTLQICFSKGMNPAVLAVLTNYLVNHSLGNPIFVTVNSSNTCVTLTFATAFVVGQLYTVTVSNLTDCLGNTLSGTTATFTYVTTVPAGFKDILINEILADINPVVGLPAAEFVELHNRSNNAIDLAGWTFTDGSSTATIASGILLPDSFLIICSTTSAPLFSGYGSVSGLPSFPALNDAGDHLQLFDSLSVLVDEVAYDLSWYHDAAKDDGGWSLELINPNAALGCTDASNWTASNDTTGGTPGRQNSVYSAAVDTTHPVIISALALDSVTLQVCFSKGMNPALLNVLTNFSVDHSIGNPSSASVNAGNTCVTLTFTTQFAVGQLYTVTVSNLTDCSGNTLSGTTATFTYVNTVPAGFKDVLINELLADVSPAVGLPSAEFVELYNRTGNAIDLAGWTFTDGTSTATISAGVLLPDSFLIICSTTNATLFSGYGNVNGLPSFPSMNDGGDHLQLFDNASMLIDDVTYDPSWYHDGTKDDGGWSLELINPDAALGCTVASNWTASNDASGGTPGRDNSVFSSALDTLRPQILSAQTIDSVTLQVCFSESMNPAYLNVDTNYSVNIFIGDASSAVANASNDCVTLTFSNPFTNGQTYIVSLAFMPDCSGNLLYGLTKQFTYLTPQPPEPFDILINEIMYEPSSTSGLPNAEYIELYNRSTKNINLDGWTITDGTDAATFTATSLAPGGYLIVAGTTEAPLLSPYGTSLGLTSFPSLNNDDGDDLKLLDNNAVLIDEVNFNDSYYHDEFKKSGGWSIERIDASFVCGNPLNWKASTDLSGGTPGQVNSVTGTFTDSVGPEATRACTLDSLHVQVYFNEQVPDTILSNITYYGISQDDIVLGNPIVASPSSDFTSVTLTLNTYIQNGIYTVSLFSPFRDCAGNIILSASSAVSFGLPSPADSGDVVLNEVLFHAVSGSNEFVELYNRSDKTINLSDLLITRRDLTTQVLDAPEVITNDCYQLLPGGFVVLTDKPEEVIAQYPLGVAKNFLKMNLPSFTDGEDDIALLSSTTFNVFDEFHYYESWQFPLLNNLAGVSLERLSPERITQDSTNWHSAAQTVGFATPGYKNSQYSEGVPGTSEVTIEPEIFSPDEDGHDDNVNIHFHLTTPGNVANVSVYDSRGRLTRTLITQELIGNDGIFSWDGVTDEKDKARIGIYIFYIELFDAAGNVRYFKKTCVVASRF